MVGGVKMTVFIVAAIIALPIAWGLSKLSDWLNGNEIIFEMEEDEEADR
jgi:hypothetical protein